MASKLIQLEDGTLVEVEIPGEQVEEISGGGFVRQVNSSWHKVEELLTQACKPIANTISEMNKEMSVEQAEVELGLSFEGEGNLYVAKSKAGANLKVKLVLKPKSN